MGTAGRAMALTGGRRRPFYRGGRAAVKIAWGVTQDPPPIFRLKCQSAGCATPWPCEAPSRLQTAAAKCEFGRTRKEALPGVAAGHGRRHSGRGGRAAFRAAGKSHFRLHSEGTPVAEVLRRKNRGGTSGCNRAALRAASEQPSRETQPLLATLPYRRRREYRREQPRRARHRASAPGGKISHSLRTPPTAVVGTSAAPSPHLDSARRRARAKHFRPISHFPAGSPLAASSGPLAEARPGAS